MNYPKGSEWRKWDLHVHAPSENTLLKKDDYDGVSSEEKMNNFIEELKTLGDIEVLGITDYFSIEGYKEVCKHKHELTNIKMIIPNLELRMAPETRDGKKINLHVIFNTEKLTEEQIELFLYSFIFPQQNRNFTCRRADLIEFGKTFDNSFSNKEALKKGLNEFFITYEKFFEILKKQDEIFKDNVLIGVSNNSEDGASGIKDLKGIRNIIYAGVDFIFSAQESDRLYFLGKGADSEELIIQKYGSLKPCIHGSDYHGNKGGRKICEPDLNRFCRIKANPTFEGLKQILYEPEERIKIQETNPNFDFDKPYFKKIIIDETIKVYRQEDSEIKITSSEIELNKNLVTIIGGRGTGKSTLIGCINNVFDNDDDFLKDENFKIVYAKNNDNNPSLENYISGEKNYLDYIYIPQGYLKKNSDKNEISKYIKNLLSIDDGFSVEISEKINSNIEKIQGIKKWFDVTDDKGNQINNKDFINAEKDKNEQMLKSIETDKNKQDLTTYITNIEKIAKIQGQVDKLKKLLSSLDEIDKINENIELINGECQDIQGFTPISKVEYVNQKSNIENNKTNLSEQITDLQSENEKIKGKFKRYAGDLQSLLSNAESYKRNITSAENQLQVIRAKETELSRLLEDRKTFGKIIYDEYMRIKNDIDNGWNNITSNRNEQQKELIENLLLKKNGNTGIKVEGSIDFDEECFYSGLFDIVDNRKYKKKEDIKEKMGITDIDSWCNFIENGFGEFSDNDKVISYFLDIKMRNNYIKVNSNISYMKKNLGHLSVGQRGTVLLCLQLATKAFSTPIIFDQPEDDLDNQFIMEELVNIFKELKKYRQIIIVTHNANLVINADAEQVIVAENNDEILTYNAGSIEDNIIRKKVCEILEGGEMAFKKRENKYGLK